MTRFAEAHGKLTRARWGTASAALAWRRCPGREGAARENLRDRGVTLVACPPRRRTTRTGD